MSEFSGSSDRLQQIAAAPFVPQPEYEPGAMDVRRPDLVVKPAESAPVQPSADVVPPSSRTPDPARLFPRPEAMAASGPEAPPPGRPEGDSSPPSAPWPPAPDRRGGDIMPSAPADEPTVVPADGPEPHSRMAFFALPHGEVGDRLEVHDRPVPGDHQGAAAADTRIDTEQYVFNGFGNSPEVPAELMERFERLGRTPYANELTLDAGERDFIARAAESTARLGDVVDSDLTKRGGVDTLHKVGSIPELQAAIATRLGWDEAQRYTTAGMNHPMTGSLFVPTGDRARDLYNATHEDMHMRSLVTVEKGPPTELTVAGVTQEWPVEEINFGYQDCVTAPDLGFSQALTELVTDMNASRVVRDVDPAYTRVAYTVIAVLLGAVVVEFAAHTDQRPIDVENGLALGMVSPNRAMYDAIGDHIGWDGMDYIANLPGELTPSQAIVVARDLGLQTPYRDLVRLREGQPVPYFAWPGRELPRPTRRIIT